MMDADKISKAADNFVRRYGRDAPRQALIRANELRAAGRQEDYATWMQIHDRVTAIVAAKSERDRF